LLPLTVKILTKVLQVHQDHLARSLDPWALLGFLDHRVRRAYQEFKVKEE
jgi:hypothetical protein